jgi:hypothetical protein
MTNINKENLAMKIMILRDQQIKGELNFDEALKRAIELINNDICSEYSACPQCGCDKSKEVRKCPDCGILYYKNQ